jgi:chromosome segregation ATPase
MHRAFAYLNLVLLLVLGATCVFQWRQEGAYNQRITSLEKESASQTNKLQVQAEELRRNSEDLTAFKQNVANLTTESETQAAELREQKARVFTLAQEKARLSTQLDAWQKALNEHKAALAQRDESITTLLAQREQIIAAQRDAATKANSAVAAYNDLTTKYEKVVNDYNTLAKQYQAERENAVASVPTK